MAGNKKPTKKYRPKGVRLNTVDYVRQGLAPLSKNLRVNLLTKVHDAMVEVTQGRGTKTHWVLVADALNTAQVLDEQTFLAAYEAEFELAHAAHAACGTRRLRNALRQGQNHALHRRRTGCRELRPAGPRGTTAQGHAL